MATKKVIAIGAAVVAVSFLGFLASRTWKAADPKKLDPAKAHAGIAQEVPSTGAATISTGKQPGITGHTWKERIGEPISGATVCVWPIHISTHKEPLAEVTSESNGSFAIVGISEGRYRVRAFADGYEYATSIHNVETLQVSENQITEGVDLVLRRGVRLFGRVLSAQDRLTPIPQALITLSSGRRVHSGDDGQYEIEGVVVDNLEVLAKATGFGERLVVLAGTHHTELRLDLYLPPGGTIRGQVKDELGEPIPGAWVGQVQTGTDGGFASVGHDRTNPARLSARAEGYARKSVGPFEWPHDGSDITTEIILDRGVEVVGRVVDPDGEPVHGAQVSRPPWRDPATSDENGNFRLTGLSRPRAGEGFTIVARKQGWAPASQFVPGGPTGDPPPSCLLTLGAPRRIEGVVVDESGEPLAEATVGVFPHGPYNTNVTVPSDENGRFLFDDLPAGYVTISADMNGHRTATGQYPVPCNDPIVLTLVRARNAQIAGTVLDAASREPVEQCNIKLDLVSVDRSRTARFPGMLRNFGAEVRSPDGTFYIRDLIEHSWNSVTIHAPGYETKVIPELQALSPEVSDPSQLVIALTRSNQLTGMVVDDETGAPIPNATVRLLAWVRPYGSPWPLDGKISDHYASIESALTDEKGRFQFDSGGTGYPGLFVAAPGYSPTRYTRIHDNHLSVGLQPFASLRGDISELQKELQERLTVSVEAGGFDHPDVFADENGGFHIENLTPGEATIRVLKGGSRWVRTKVISLSPGQETSITLGADSPIMTGTVTQQGVPIEGAQVWFDGKDSATSWTDSRGGFRVLGLSPGDYRLEVLVGDWVSSGRTQRIQRVTVGEKDQHFDIALPAGRLEGQYVPASSQARAGVRVTAHRWLETGSTESRWEIPKGRWSYERNVKTLDDGSFEFVSLPGGRYVLTVGNFATSVFTLTESETRRDFILSPRAESSVTVRVVGPMDKVPVAKTRLLVLSESGVPLEYGMTDPDGLWTSSSLPLGTYQLLAGVTYGRPVRKVFKSTGEETQLEVALPRSGAVRFRVLGAEYLGASPFLRIHLDEVVTQLYGNLYVDELLVFLHSGEGWLGALSQGPHKIRVGVCPANDDVDVFRDRQKYLPVVEKQLSIMVPEMGECLVEISLQQ